MVALLRHQPSTTRPHPAPVGHRSGPPPLRLVAGERTDWFDPRHQGQDQEPDTGGSARAGGALAGRPKLELVPGVDGVAWPSAAVIAVVALMVFGLFGLVRVAQGSAGTSAEVGIAEVIPGPGDRVIVAGEGDSLWSIAVSMSPDGDPRPVVAALIEANGGETIRIGQQIVIPARLLD